MSLDRPTDSEFFAVAAPETFCARLRVRPYARNFDPGFADPTEEALMRRVEVWGRHDASRFRSWTLPETLVLGG